MNKKEIKKEIAQEIDSDKDSKGNGNIKQKF